MQACSVAGCENPLHGKVWCEKHYRRFKRHGHPLGSGQIGRPRQNEVSFKGVHARWSRRFGPAKMHTCRSCGKQAYDYAYKLPTGYSHDPNDYEPLCRRCHLAKDGMPGVAA